MFTYDMIGVAWPGIYYVNTGNVVRGHVLARGQNAMPLRCLDAS